MAIARRDILRAEARHARERFQLHKARTYGGRLTSPTRLRELQRISEVAEARLHTAEAEQERRAPPDDSPTDATPRPPKPGGRCCSRVQ